MNRTTLPGPPDPTHYSDMMSWQKQAYSWMQKVKQQIETDSAANTTPIGPFVVSTFTAVSTMTGTDDLSNFVATLVTAMQKQGITAANIKRTTT